ncbi:MAG: hypothetical protein IT233_00690 [Bacteroidia bacterium]|jgi:hypothetical protein|nr:hypothetical protein [Bacteroidia bacterium]
MDERRLVSTVTFLSSLCGYFYAKHFHKDAVPIVMMSGFFGAMIGESIYKILSKDDNDKNPPAAPTA